MFALGGFADRVGLAGALFAAVPPRGGRTRVHDRGKVLVRCSATLARKLRDRDIGFMVSARSNPALEAAVGLMLGETSRWHSVAGNRRLRRDRIH